MSTINFDCYALASLMLLHWISYTVAAITIYYVYACIKNHNDTGLQILAKLRNNRKFFFVILVALASAAGFPPFFGFWSKTALIVFITEAGTLTLQLICCITLLISIILYFTPARILLSWQPLESSQSIDESLDCIYILAAVVILVVCPLVLGDAYLISYTLFI